ncbi:MAG: hypothetical protein M1130_03355 [Actinobacteria bacterium]|nr:hypothetical protein [Actinomycetota bacterium]
MYILEIILTIIVIYLFSYFNIFIHELGHLLVGRLLRIEIYSVEIGDGKELWKKKVFNTLFILNKGWIGLTTIRKITPRFIKLRIIIFAAGGVALQVIAMALCIVLFGLESKGIVNLSAIFVLSNFLMVISNLIPRRVNIKGIKIPSDGLTILKTPFLKEKEIEEILNVDKLIEAYQLLQSGEYSVAAMTYQKYIHKVPTSEIAHINYSISLMRCLKFEEAKSVLINLNQNIHNKKYDYFIYNNLAWLYLLDMNENSLTEADILSKRAFELNPKEPFVLDTRGCVLIELGRYDEGIDMLEKQINLKKPTGLMYISYGYYKKGVKEKELEYNKYLENYLNELTPDEVFIYEKIKSKNE